MNKTTKRPKASAPSHIEVMYNLVNDLMAADTKASRITLFHMHNIIEDAVLKLMAAEMGLKELVPTTISGPAKGVSRTGAK